MVDLASRITKPEDAAASLAPPEPETGLNESTYEVEVKLSELQNDTNSPLYSAATFESLNLYVLLPRRYPTLSLARA